MATTASFNALLKNYMPYDMQVEEMKKRNYFWNKVKKDQSWKGGNLQLPIEAGEASSLSFGALTSTSDVAEGSYLVGEISTQPELWGTMKFYEKDLDRHGDLEASFLKILPGKLNQFMDRMSERVSLSLLGDGSMAKLTSDGANGSIVVDHPERFTIGEKIVIDDDNSSPVDAYVTAININTKTLTIQDARSSGSNVNATGYTVAQNAKVFLPGAQASGFTSLISQLLSAANGGGTTIAGLTKTAAPMLQALQHDGSEITADNILDILFDKYYDTVSLGKGNPTEILCSFTHFKNIAKTLEVSREYSVTDKKAGYGWRSVSLIGSEGEMTITALRDMSDSYMPVLDWDSFQFHGFKFFDRKRHLDGNEFFLERATSGYAYLVDTKFYGDLVVSKPSHCGIIHSISY